MSSRKIAAVALAAALGALGSGASHATLFDRGGGLIYDDFLDITWLADANYAFTSHYSDGILMDPYGAMEQGRASDWAAQLDYHDTVRNVTWSDWRLPTIINQPGRAACDNTATSLTGKDCGFNVSTAVDLDADGKADTVYSELAYMYYVNLGFKAINPGTGVGTPTPSTGGIFRDGSTGGELDGVGPNGAIINLKSGPYWSSTPAPTNIFGDVQAFYLDLSNGQQYFDDVGVPMYAWAVMDGDVAAVVPEPSSVSLLGVAIGLMVIVARRRRRS